MDDFLIKAQPYLTFAKDTVTLVSLAIAAFVAINGLQTWRRQLKGTTDYDLAKRLLKAAYRLRDALQAVRNPFMSSGEIQHAIKEVQLEVKPPDEDFNAASTAAAYQLRWRPVIEAYQSLELEAFEAEALWGPSAKDVIIATRRAINSLSVAIDLVLRDRQPGGTRILDGESREKFERILYSMARTPEDDPYLKELTAAVAQIETLARPFLAR
jgi:hypothetical protein